MKKTIITFLFIIVYLSGYAQDSKVYKGNSTFMSAIVYTIKDGKAYKGNSTFTRDIVYTIKDGKVYKGDSTFTSDIINTIE